MLEILPLNRELKIETILILVTHFDSKRHEHVFLNPPPEMLNFHVATGFQIVRAERVLTAGEVLVDYMAAAKAQFDEDSLQFEAQFFLECVLLSDYDRYLAEQNNAEPEAKDRKVKVYRLEASAACYVNTLRGLDVYIPDGSHPHVYKCKSLPHTVIAVGLSLKYQKEQTCPFCEHKMYKHSPYMRYRLEPLPQDENTKDLLMHKRTATMMLPVMVDRRCCYPLKNDIGTMLKPCREAQRRGDTYLTQAMIPGYFFWPYIRYSPDIILLAERYINTTTKAGELCAELKDLEANHPDSPLCQELPGKIKALQDELDRQENDVRGFDLEEVCRSGVLAAQLAWLKLKIFYFYQKCVSAWEEAWQGLELLLLKSGRLTSSPWLFKSEFKLNGRFSLFHGVMQLFSPLGIKTLTEDLTGKNGVWIPFSWWRSERLSILANWSFYHDQEKNWSG